MVKLTNHSENEREERMLHLKKSKLNRCIICTSSYLHHWVIASGSSGRRIYLPHMKKIFKQCFNRRTRIGSYRLEWNFISNLIKQVDGLLQSELGAGQRITTKNLQQTIRQSASSISDMQALCDLSCFINPATIIELGTSAGFTTRALALASPNTKIISIEGNSNLYNIAKQHLSTFQNIELHCGFFDEVLPNLEYDKCKPIFVFIDGNHTYEASLRYVTKFLKFAVAGSAIVLHDIRWSEDMLKAWKKIKTLEFTGLTLESYTMGIIFLRKEKEKQEFFIRY